MTALTDAEIQDIRDILRNDRMGNHPQPREI